jgi:ketopantoate reductase
MSITIYGAGAIGGLVGACMARAGEDVLLVDKVPEHVRRKAPVVGTGVPRWPPPSSVMPT